ncbi:MAG: hypothetical protein AAB541_01015 [Patescibacteria group bacterium]
MAKGDKSAMVSGAGLLAAFTTDLFKQVRELGAPDENLHRALSDPNVIKKFAELVADLDVQHITLEQTSHDPTIDLEVQIRRGQYKYVDPGIKELVPGFFPTALLPKSFALIDPCKMLSSEEALDLLNRRGYRPATFVELIALGAANRQLGTQLPVISLSPGALTVTGTVLMLAPFDGDRQLELRSGSGITWAWMTRYLAVRVRK